MKFARFQAGDKTLWGVVEGEAIRAIAGNYLAEFALTDDIYPLSQVTLLAPVEPSKIIGVGLNYKAVAVSKGTEFPAEPILFLKPLTTLIGPGDDIVIPEMVKSPAFEVELAVVIGKKAKNVTEEDALDYVFGYTLANDVTAKDHMVKGQPWTKGKSFDTFTPVGPYLVTSGDPAKFEISLTVNGVEKQHSLTDDMIFNVQALIAFISSVMTLMPGDLILTGTPVGGSEFSRGDLIGLACSQIGTMKNRAV